MTLDAATLLGQNRWMPNRGLRCSLMLVLVAAVATAGCASNERIEQPPPEPWDFFGVIDTVEFGEPPVTSPWARGGPDSAFGTPAMTWRLTDATRLEVPSGTPGGNRCRNLAPGRAENIDCFVAGGLSGSEVTWFEILGSDPTPRKYGGGRQYTVDLPDSLNADGLIYRGYEFPAVSDVRVECEIGYGITTLAAATDPITGLEAQGIGFSAIVSVPEGNLINIYCLYQQ